jgi:hypothetical protein
VKRFINIKRIFAAGIIAASAFLAVPAFAATTLYQQVTNEVLSKGISYTVKHTLTDAGWLDIYVLETDMSNPNINIAPVDSKTNVGLRETLDKILSENKAVAGVNSGFFGMTKKYSASFGPEISHGDIISLDTDKNLDSNQFGTFFIDKNSNPLFGYFKTNMTFYANNTKIFDFSGINKITQMVYPVYIDKNAFVNTAELDARFSNLYKIKVEDGKITYISQPGETVNVPDDGYLIVFNDKYGADYVRYLAVGQNAETKITSSFDLDSIETAVSGGGIFMQDGKKCSNVGEMATGRQPRTLLGLSADEKTLKLIVIDGKRAGGNNTSIGANIDECVNILQKEGCAYGMNLDGGGSSTMATKNAETGNVKIINSPAEGVARQIVSAVGVFDNSTVGSITSLKMSASSKSAVKGGQIVLTLSGYDDNLHKLSVPKSGLNITSDDSTGTFSYSGNNIIYTCGDAANAKITAAYNGAEDTVDIKGATVKSISPKENIIYLKSGESTKLSVIGAATDGSTVDVSNLAEYYSDFGTINGNTFTSDADGVGIIECTYGNSVCYIKVCVGTKETKVDSFENVKYLNFSSYPKTITGIAGISKKYVADGGGSLGLSYNFADSNFTQAAYLELVSPVTINDKADKLKLRIYGNGSGQWVRAKIKDANGKESVIDFSKDVSWNGWANMDAELPQDITFPIKLTCIYVAAITNSNTNTQIMYFDDLRAETYNNNEINIPQSTASNDGFEGTINGKRDGYFYVNMVGTVSSGAVNDSSLYDSVRNKVNSLIKTDADVSVYGGKSDIQTGSSETIKWKNDYAVYYSDNVTLINMTAVNGGFKATKADQWQKFKNDVLESSNNYVVFFMDTTPSNFSDSMESNLFKSALNDIRNAGREVFVVSSSGTSYWKNIQNGVRYINLPSLFTSDGKVNSDFRMLKMEFGTDSVTYNVTKPSLQ